MYLFEPSASTLPFGNGDLLIPTAPPPKRATGPSLSAVARRLEAPLSETAIHEAGHGVVAFAYCIPFTAVRLNSDGSGDTLYGRGFNSSPEALAGRAASVVAGGLAAMIHYHRVFTPARRDEFTSESDKRGLQILTEEFATLHPGMRWPCPWMNALTVLNSNPGSAAVHLVARLLAGLGNVSEAVVQQACRECGLFPATPTVERLALHTVASDAGYGI